MAGGSPADKTVVLPFMVIFILPSITVMYSVWFYITVLEFLFMRQKIPRSNALTHLMPMWWDVYGLGTVFSCGDNLHTICLDGILWFCLILFDFQGHALATVRRWCDCDICQFIALLFERTGAKDNDFRSLTELILIAQNYSVFFECSLDIQVGKLVRGIDDLGGQQFEEIGCSWGFTKKEPRKRELSVQMATRGRILWVTSYVRGCT